MKKTYCLDTNVLLSDANAVFSFDDNDVIIPLVVLEELDAHKNRQDEVGRNARQVNRLLDDFRHVGSLMKGIKLPAGGILRILPIDDDAMKQLPEDLESDKIDNMIIAFVKAKSISSPVEVVLITQDINVRIKCDSLGIKCEDYRKMKVANDVSEFYTGVAVVEIDKESIDLHYKKGLTLPHDRSSDKYPNQIIVLKNVEGERKTGAITRFVSENEPLAIVSDASEKGVCGLKPRNKEQNFSLDLLTNPDIKLVTLTGAAGTGKTILALAAGLHQLKTFGEQPTYDKVIVSRPVQPLGRDIGFLPGSIDEKMEPWLAPIRDNLDFLFSGAQHKISQKTNRNKKDHELTQEPYFSLLQDKGLIEIEAITFIRGRSIPNSFIVIDECQNLSVHELKTILTRSGEGSKVVLVGDLEQIDNSHLDIYTNGLSYAIERFKEHSIAAHVTLLKGERSQLATLASKIL